MSALPPAALMSGSSAPLHVVQRQLDAKEFRRCMEKSLEPGIAQDLRGVVVYDQVDLTDTKVGNIDLTGAHFKSPVVASRSIWLGMAWLKQCVFEGGVDFTASKFANDACFDGSYFRGNAVFSRSQISGQFVLDQAIFEGPAYLDKLELLANLSLSGTVFRDVASFEESECMGGLWGNGVRFEGRANARGMEVHGRLWLVGASAPAPVLGQVTSYGYCWS